MVVIELPLILFIFKHYVWIVPLVIATNLFAFWLTVRYLVLKVIIFPYSIGMVLKTDEIKLN